MEQHFEKLLIWQKGMDLVDLVYSLTKRYPDSERYGLTSQLRAASVSIPSNIAEGKGRHYTKDYIRFLYMARGSAYEVMTLAKLSKRQSLLSEKESDSVVSLCGEISGGINALIKALS